VTPSESVEHLKARMLQEAVNSHLDAIHGRRSEPLHPVEGVERVRLRESGRTSRSAFFIAMVRLAAFSIAVVTASAGLARWRAPARTVPDTVIAAVPAMVPAASNAALDPSVLSQPVHPGVLDLSVHRVIVDAGHGGDNLGTSSAGGINEKDLTLDIAERLRQLVVQRGFEAVMTRTADETRSLLERAATANLRRGDIFISVHLNSLRPSSARGIETYYLGPSHDPELDAVAAVENRDSGYSLSDIRSLLEKIYTDARRDESRRLAESVQRALVLSLRKTAPAITDRGVKTAPFVVLIATEMPAIVAEVSCLSNEADVRRLNTGEYRQTIAEALLSGIQTFADGSRVGATRERGISGN
jgi:N-acetylmuramoyl-L-alanine amidase